MSTRRLTEIKRQAPEAVLAGLRSDQLAASREAGEKIVVEARSFGLNLRDYLTLAIDPSLAANDNKDRFKGMTGYEASLAYLGLPVRDDFEAGVTLDLASDTFATYPGTRALFPEVIDDMVRWNYRQENLESLSALIAGSRTINGTEMVTTVVSDSEKDYKGTRPIAELSEIPVKSIRSTQTAVQLFKHGSAYRTSYEFSRRARLDMLTPFANRMGREFERSKVAAATALLINGDGTAEHAAAPVVNQSTFGALGTVVNGKLNYTSLLQWFVSRAQAGVPVDVVVGNWDAYLQWLAMFALPIAGAGDKSTAAENLARAGYQIGGVPILQGTVNFALSSAAPANKIIGLNKGETLEELVEAGSLIEESEREPSNQSITYYKTEVSGCTLRFGDTRSILDFAN